MYRCCSSVRHGSNANRSWSIYTSNFCISNQIDCVKRFHTVAVGMLDHEGFYLKSRSIFPKRPFTLSASVNVATMLSSRSIWDCFVYQEIYKQLIRAILLATDAQCKWAVMFHIRWRARCRRVGTVYSVTLNWNVF